MPVKQGDVVKVEYTGTFENGEVFDSSEKHGQPLEVTVGEQQVIKGFESALMGMNEGEEKSVTLPPAEAYGDVNPQLVQTVPKDKLPQDQEIKEGMMLGVGLPTGQQVPATVKKVTESDVTIDLNHPLAGKTLNFKLKVVSIGN